MEDLRSRLRKAYLKAIIDERPGAGRAVVRGVTSFLSTLYVKALRFRAFLYRHRLLPSQKLPVPVISVGNLTCGGTGKTPMVEYVAKALLTKWRRPAILSRGYRAQQTEEGMVNDEYLLLKQNMPDIPHFAGPDRIKKVREAIAQGDVDSVVLDDGFQNLRARDKIDIVLIDALDPFSNRRVIPRGLLREPVEGLERAHAIVISRSNQCSLEALREIRRQIKDVAPGIPVALGIHRAIGLVAPDGKTEQSCEWLAKRRVWAFCGIGNPNSFKLTLKKTGTIIAGLTVFPDHHTYTLDELKRLHREAEEVDAEALVTTQKDGVKLKLFSQFGELPLYVLKIEADLVHGADELEQQVLDW